jgi:hypothetical protein
VHLGVGYSAIRPFARGLGTSAVPSSARAIAIQGNSSSGEVSAGTSARYLPEHHPSTAGVRIFLQ